MRQKELNAKIIIAEFDNTKEIKHFLDEHGINDYEQDEDGYFFVGKFGGFTALRPYDQHTFVFDGNGELITENYSYIETKE